MNVEDILLSIHQKLTVTPAAFDYLLSGPWYRGFIDSVAQQIGANRALSTKQSREVLKIIAKLSEKLVADGIDRGTLDELLANPSYRIKPYLSYHVPREVRYLGDNLLAFRSKPDRVLTMMINDLGRSPRNGFEASLSRPRFDWTYKIWIIPVNRSNLAGIEKIIQNMQFALDVPTQNYIDACHRCFGEPSAAEFSDDSLIVRVPDDPCLSAWIVQIAGGIAL